MKSHQSIHKWNHLLPGKLDDQEIENIVKQCQFWQVQHAFMTQYWGSTGTQRYSIIPCLDAAQPDWEPNTKILVVMLRFVLGNTKQARLIKKKTQNLIDSSQAFNIPQYTLAQDEARIFHRISFYNNQNKWKNEYSTKKPKFNTRILHLTPEDAQKLIKKLNFEIIKSTLSDLSKPVAPKTSQIMHCIYHIKNAPSDLSIKKNIKAEALLTFNTETGFENGNYISSIKKLYHNIKKELLTRVDINKIHHQNHKPIHVNPASRDIEKYIKIAADKNLTMYLTVYIGKISHNNKTPLELIKFSNYEDFQTIVKNKINNAKKHTTRKIKRNISEILPSNNYPVTRKRKKYYSIRTKLTFHKHRKVLCLLTKDRNPGRNDCLNIHPLIPFRIFGDNNKLTIIVFNDHMSQNTSLKKIFCNNSVSDAIKYAVEFRVSTSQDSQRISFSKINQLNSPCIDLFYNANIENNMCDLLNMFKDTQDCTDIMWGIISDSYQVKFDFLVNLKKVTMRTTSSDNIKLLFRPPPLSKNSKLFALLLLELQKNLIKHSLESRSNNSFNTFQNLLMKTTKNLIMPTETTVKSHVNSLCQELQKISNNNHQLLIDNLHKIINSENKY